MIDRSANICCDQGAVMMNSGNGTMINRALNDYADGAPLAVCISDCKIDQGTPPAELARVCFYLGCAFAQMRWGVSGESSDNTKEQLSQHFYKIIRAKL